MFGEFLIWMFFACAVAYGVVVVVNHDRNANDFNEMIKGKCRKCCNNEGAIAGFKKTLFKTKKTYSIPKYKTVISQDRDGDFVLGSKQVSGGDGKKEVFRYKCVRCGHFFTGS